ncbi:MAG: hypothetical protein KBS81_10010, partial [Spirochaetales bacterium]|nr:hypothetical protein [Candidatus Physcosoma equi]
LLLLLSALVLFLFCVLLGGTAEVVKNWSNYQSETWNPFRKGILRNIRHSLLFFLVVMALIAMAFIAIPFYISMGNIFGMLVAVLLFWVEFLTIVALSYYYPLMNLLPGDDSLKTLKKCFLILFDNLGFSILLFAHNLLDLGLSIFTMGIMPGVCGLMLGTMDAGKLLMKKYDWQEENPGRSKSDMDWDELLFEEKENLGPRTLKNMIFPWK